ncbi:MAG: DUF1428 domain-containing protein [Pseudomonadota bacterium]
MTYFEGFIVPVPEANKAAYEKHATEFAPLVRKIGVERMVESWDSDVPEGKVTDFRKAVDAKPDEKIVFSWFEYPNRQARDAANEKFMSDPQMAEMGANMPFDGKRMVMGGFGAITEIGEGPGGYINGFIMPVPGDKKEAFREMTARQGPIFREYGALRVVHAWGDDVPEGKVTDFRRSVDAKPDETVVFAFIEWPSKKTSDEAWERLMKDERMQPTGDMPFDGKRMFWGGFEKILDTAEAQVQQQPAPITA